MDTPWDEPRLNYWRVGERRKMQLAETIYWHAFGLLDGEIDIPGDIAGECAAAAQSAVERVLAREYARLDRKEGR